MKIIALAALVVATLFVSPLLAADPPKPKPLTDKQRADVLIVANATSNARQAVLALELQYRAMREQQQQALQKAEADEQALVAKLKKEAGAVDGCGLTEKAEWKCEAPKVEAAKK